VKYKKNAFKNYVTNHTILTRFLSLNLLVRVLANDHLLTLPGIKDDVFMRTIYINQQHCLFVSRTISICIQRDVTFYKRNAATRCLEKVTLTRAVIIIMVPGPLCAI